MMGIIGNVYNVGPGQPYATIGSVPWKNLQPGDTVNIYWQATPYYENIRIAGSGITVNGVPGPQGQLPVIDGTNAVTSPNAPVYTYFPIQDYGLILVYATSTATQPTNITIQNLQLQGAIGGTSYIAVDGSGRTYVAGAGGIWSMGSVNLLVKGCIVTNNDNGIFAKSGGSWPTTTTNITLDSNYVYGNGVVGQSLYHNTYIEAYGAIYQFNRYGNLRSGAGGDCLKDRSSGLIIRYNSLLNGAHILDLDDPQDGYPQITTDPRYLTSLVYGNQLITDWTGPTTVIKYGDGGDTNHFRDGSTLYFYNNTLVSYADQTGTHANRWRTIIFYLQTAGQTVDARNNIFFNVPYTSTLHPPTMEFMQSAGNLILGNNWVSPGWIESEAKEVGWAYTGTITGENNLFTDVLNNPGFLNFPNDLHLDQGSNALGKGTALAPTALPVDKEYFYDQSSVSRTTISDLGMFEGIRMGTVNLNWNQTYQSIDGFGASCAWEGLTSAQADYFFTTLGLTFIRTMVPDGSTTVQLSSQEVDACQKAIARGAKVWAAPWSPPAAWKSNNSVSNGGSLLPVHYQDYANYLVSYIKAMMAQGVSIYALSVQNEPDYTATYDSCIWTSQQFHDFIAILGPAISAAGLTTKIIMPEESGWHFELSAATMADPITASYVSILAAHDYDGGSGPYITSDRLWQTEVSDFGTFDPSMASALAYANKINTFLKNGVNAWHYWWLISQNADNEGLLGQGGAATKRASSIGNFSKFVTPGMVRINESDDGSLLCSAYRDPNTNVLSIIMVNSGSANNVTVNLAGFVVSSLTPYLTDSTHDISQQSPVAVTGSSFTYALGAQSIVTLTGIGSPTVMLNPPTITVSSTSTQITLSWASTGATSYNIYRGTSSGTETYLTSTAGTSYVDAAVSQGVVYYYLVTSVQESAKSNEVSIALQAPSQGSPVVAINAGGGAAGTFLPDQDFVNGGTYSNTDTIDISHVTSPAPILVYQSLRYGNMNYVIPNLTPNASYTVRLHFAEIYFWQSGQRVFNVLINGVQVLTNFDIVGVSGSKDRALIETFRVTADANGKINIGFVNVTNNAQINGIEITT